MTGNDVISAVSIDMRRMIGTSGSDATLVMGWVDRVQKEILQTSPIYNTLMSTLLSVTTTAGTSTYIFPGAAFVRKINWVYDRTTNRPLLPIDQLAAPVPLNDPTSASPERFPQLPSKFLLNESTNSVRPEYYDLASATSLILFPAPANAANAGILDVQAETKVATVTDAAATLTLTDDGLAAIIAGVNVFASLYLKRPDEAQAWQQLYSGLKVGESK